MNWKTSQMGIKRVRPEYHLIRPTPTYKKDIIIYPGSKEPPEPEPFPTLYPFPSQNNRNAKHCLVAIPYHFGDKDWSGLFSNTILLQLRNEMKVF